jgi:hypothetical protein
MSIAGNNKPNTLIGTERHDYIRAFGGDDFVEGLEGDDRTEGRATAMTRLDAVSSGRALRMPS